MIRRVARPELNELAREWGFSLAEHELDAYGRLAEWVCTVLDGLDERPAPAARVARAERDPGRRPTREEDPLNALVRLCRVRSADEGVLSGVRVAVKDSVAIAGVPMTCGSRVFQSFVPDRDSVVTERILGAGGEIVATTNMDNLAFSGGGDTSAYGPTLNPFDATRTAGGSSSGSGAALHYDGIDVAVGADQGGSIRVPAAWCGVVGLKPTHGLVPYTAIAGIDATFDHCGPMAPSVEAAARLLQAIAGPHPSDPRTQGAAADDYLRAVGEAPERLDGVRLGVVAEGVAAAQPVVAEAFDAALERLRALGAALVEVSVPEHERAGGVAFPGFIEGMTALVAGGGNGWHRGGEYWPELALAFRGGLAAYAQELSPQVKLTLILGTHLRRCYAGALYAKAQNLRPALRESYDGALAGCDALVMPTTPGLPHSVDPALEVDELVIRGWAVLGNTAATDMTGHPALSVPAAEAEGLPVGVMLVGRHGGDARLLALARTVERDAGPRPAAPAATRPQ